ncbi:MAG: serine/threonine protein kinase [Deltaproteobacteria bacterium]|nr:MAG: serine/threonine protein kinase [Deltaproteobacteria bacterium]
MLSEGDRIGDWIVDKTLGEGGMGAVYLAHNVLSTRVRAAVKVLKPHSLGDARKRFVREVELVASVQHPAVVRVLGGGEDTERGLLYMAMEYLEGEELKDRLERGPLTWQEAATLFEQLGSGLLAAHRMGVVHRDIKPQNIWLCADGSGKLLDFGIAVQDGGTKLTRAGAVPGTVAYMPPEVFQGQSPDHRADIYALGLVLWEALTGQEAFPEDPTTSQKQAIVQIMGQKLQSEPLDPGDTAPQEVRELVRQATEPEPTVRLSDLEAFVTVLKTARSPGDTYQLPPSTRPVTTRPPTPPPPKGGGGRGVALVGAGLLGGGVLMAALAVVIIAAAGVIFAVSRAPSATPVTIAAPAPGPATMVSYRPKADVPDGFPFDVPKDANIITGMINESAGSKTYVVSYAAGSSLDHEELVAKYTKAFEKRDLNMTNSRSTDANGVTDTVVGWSTKEQCVAVIAPPMAMFGKGPYVTLTFTPN